MAAGACFSWRSVDDAEVIGVPGGAILPQQKLMQPVGRPVVDPIADLKGDAATTDVVDHTRSLAAGSLLHEPVVKVTSIKPVSVFDVTQTQELPTRAAA